MNGEWLGVAVAREFFPPDFSPHYLAYLAQPVAQTLAMAAGSIVVAVVLAIPLGIAIGTRAPGSRALYATLASIRAIPDLTLAIFCVVIIGIGPGAGLMALSIFYGAAMGKVFGELFLSADPAPLDALRATGASRVSVAAFGLLPLKMADLLTYGAYELECAIRASVIVGAVGAGGIGVELVGALNAFEYRRVTTLLLLLLALIGLIDRWRWVVRKRPRAVLMLLPVGVASLWFYWPGLLAARHALSTFASMLPPRLDASQVRALPTLLLQTLGMAAAGTLMAMLMALPLAFAATRGVASARARIITRRLFDFLRAVPELVWGLLLLTVVGVGPTLGVVALGLHGGGVLGKLYAESLENVRRAPVRALEATGASALTTAVWGNLPLAFGAMLVHTLYHFEWDVRAATVLGVIGAGGIGEALYNAQQLFFYQEMLAYVLVTWLLVTASDSAGAFIRRRLRVAWEAMP